MLKYNCKDTETVVSLQVIPKEKRLARSLIARLDKDNTRGDWKRITFAENNK